MVIALDQWRSYRKHLPAVLGAGVTVLFLIVLGHFFGQGQMLLILQLFRHVRNVRSRCGF